MKIVATAGARRAVRRVRESGHSDLSLVIGTGCCDATSPFLYDSYLVDPDAETVGDVEGVPVYAPRWLAKLYPDDDTLELDVDEGLVNDSLSLESDDDCRLVLRVPGRIG
jgi:uncharacterized protein (DUF779 family)